MSTNLRKIDKWERVGLWPHVNQNEDGSWDGILRSFKNEEVIKWRCGHGHRHQVDARSCSRWQFDRRYEGLIDTSVPESPERGDS